MKTPASEALYCQTIISSVAELSPCENVFTGCHFQLGHQ